MHNMAIMNLATYQPTTKQANHWTISIQSTWAEYQTQTARLRDMLLLRDNEEAEWDQRDSLAGQVEVIMERLQALQDQDPWGIGLMQDAQELHQEMVAYLKEINPMISFMEDESELVIT